MPERYIGRQRAEVIWAVHMGPESGKAWRRATMPAFTKDCHTLAKFPTLPHAPVRIVPVDWPPTPRPFGVAPNSRRRVLGPPPAWASSPPFRG